MKKSILLIVFTLGFGVLLFAQEKEESKEASSSKAQANNPLANMTAVSFQNY